MTPHRNRMLVRIIRLMELADLARELGVSSRTVRRDLAALSEAHWPVPPSSWHLEHQR